MSRFMQINTVIELLTLMALVFSAGFTRISDRVNITLLGYQLGKLKHEEKELLQKTSELENELSHISSVYVLRKYTKNIPGHSSPLIGKDKNE